MVVAFRNHNTTTWMWDGLEDSPARGFENVADCNMDSPPGPDVNAHLEKGVRSWQTWDCRRAGHFR